MLNDERIKSCLSRFDSGAYSDLQFLRVVSHSVGAHTESIQLRDDDSNSSSSSEDEGEDRQAPVSRHRQRQLQGRRNRQRQPRQRTRTTVAKCASWRHVLASHWCRADMRGSVKRVLCVCHLRMGKLINQSINFIVRPNVDQRAGQLSLPALPHV